MNYVFMDNFRGFNKTIIPLRRANFLVGENSTGKSSFLSILGLLSTPQFWLSQDFAISQFSNLGGFNDMVSVASDVKDRFTIGNIRILPEKNGIEDSRRYDFNLMTFRNEAGLPKLTRYLQYRKGRMFKILYFPKSIRYKVTNYSEPFETNDAFIQFTLKMFRDDLVDRKGFTNLRSKFRFESRHPIPVPLIADLIRSMEKKGLDEEGGIAGDIPISFDLTWLAPVRTKPKRIYGGFKTNYTPEGDHTPHVIKKTLNSRDKAQKFKRLIEKFGKSSGLFTQVKAHKFGKDPSAPFEVQVEINGEPLNISNVGYGVSQILPVLVEMLTCEKGQWFAIQQPEVHLHPRAQAALGELMHYLVKEHNHHYVVETHSDYLIDRFRLKLKKSKGPKGCQVIFFEKSKRGNQAYPIQINEKGQYAVDQPKSFRNFFIREEMQLLEI